MAGTLTVQNIEGPSSGVNANKIIIPSGHTLDASGGTLVPSAGQVVQVEQGLLTGTSTSASTSFTDIGLSVDITPEFSTSKIVVMASVQVAGDSGQRFGARIVRVDGSAQAVPQEGDSAGSRTRVHAAGSGSTVGGNVLESSLSMQIFDSPATTNLLTYKVQILSEGSSAYYVNRSRTDADASTIYRTSSQITVMEIAQ